MICCFAMSSIIVDQKIFDEARDKIKACSVSHPSFITKKLCQFVSCHFCTGFWSGVVLTIIAINPFNLTMLDPLIGGLVGSVSSYYINLVFTMVEKYAEKTFDDIEL